MILDVEGVESLEHAEKVVAERRTAPPEDSKEDEKTAASE